MIWLLGGYTWLYVHRPFEIWEVLGTLQLERAYVLLMLLFRVVMPGKGLVPNRIHAGLLVFALVLVAAWLASPYAGSPACLEVVENYFKVVVFYVLVVTTVRDERSLRLLLLMYLASVALYAGHSFLEYLNGRVEYRQSVNRMVGVDVTYRDPNAFASALLFALPMTFPFWAERPRRVPRTVLLGFTTLACLCILLTGSRSGFLGILVIGVLALFVFVRRKAVAVALAGTFAVVFAVLLAVALPGELQKRYMTIIDPSAGPKNAQESAEGRIEGFLGSLDVWQHSPLTGQGPGSYPEASGTGYQPHNLYGQVLAEMGVAGAAALLLLVACFLLNWLETRRLFSQLRELEFFAPDGPPSDPEPPFAYLVSRSVAVALVLMLLLGLGGHNLYRYQWQWFAAYQAIAVGCLRARLGRATQAATYEPELILHYTRAVPPPTPI